MWDDPCEVVEFVEVFSIFPDVGVSAEDFVFSVFESSTKSVRTWLINLPSGSSTSTCTLDDDDDDVVGVIVGVVLVTTVTGFGLASL